jgi:hypothetical protein
MAIGVFGKRIIEVLSSMVTAPAAVAAGTRAEGKGEGAAPPKEGVELNVFTVLISVFVGKVFM